MARSREDARAVGALTLKVLGNVDHFDGSTLAAMMASIGCTVTDRGNTAIAWLPRGETPPDEPCINRDTDADKHNLADHFFCVFRYPLGVDPLTYRGPIVSKSIRNGAHDGRVLTAPIQTLNSDTIYQHLIDNRTPGGIIDLRVPYIDGMGPICWVKRRSMERRFASQSEWARLATPIELFSSDERRLLTEFCKAIHLEYGELDVLRDVRSDSIYVVDVNPTPYPLTEGIVPQEWARAVRQMATRFQEVFLS